MQVAKPDIRSPAELLKHMQASQMAYINNTPIEPRRVRLLGVPGWYWLVAHLAYSAVGKKAIVVPSASSTRETLDMLPRDPVRMVRFGVPGTEHLQAWVHEVSGHIAAAQKKGASAAATTRYIKSATGLSVNGAGAKDGIAFRYPGKVLSLYFVYGLVIRDRATFVLSATELEAAETTRDAADELFAALRSGIANAQTARVFDQEPDMSARDIRGYLRSAQPLPASN